MKKKLLSLVCALALTISLLPAAQALEGEGTRAAEALASLGLVTGTGAGYAAEKPATQEQAAALLGAGCYHHGIRRFGHGPGHDVRSGLL